MIYNTQDLTPNKIYQIMAQTIIPRPIAWIVTQANGVTNIAPFSFFTPLSSNPATLMVSIGYKDENKTILKDTLVNIKDTNKCTICVVDEHNLEKMHFSSKTLPKEQSEAEEFNIATKVVSEDFPPMIENASISYMCTLNQTIDLGADSTIPVILNVHNIFIDDSKFMDDDKKVIEFNPVARVGREYTHLTKKIPTPKIP